MKPGDYINLVLSCGIAEEGIIESVNFVDEMGINCLILKHKNNDDVKLNINKQYIAAYQISNVILEKTEDIQPLIVDDLTLNIPEVDPKIRIKKLAELGVERGISQRERLKKIINKPVNDKIENIKYQLPEFLNLKK